MIRTLVFDVVKKEVSVTKSPNGGFKALNDFSIRHIPHSTPKQLHNYKTHVLDLDLDKQLALTDHFKVFHC